MPPVSAFGTRSPGPPPPPWTPSALGILWEPRPSALATGLPGGDTHRGGSQASLHRVTPLPPRFQNNPSRLGAFAGGFSGPPRAVPRPPPQRAQRGWYTRRLLPGRSDVLVHEGSVKPRGDSSEDKWGSFRVTSCPGKKTCVSVCPKHHRSWAFSGIFWPCSLSSSSWLLGPMEPRGWPWPGPVTAWLSGLPRGLSPLWPPTISSPAFSALRLGCLPGEFYLGPWPGLLWLLH